MGFEETDYVYKIEVRGTGIKEYYDIPKKLSEREVKEMWLNDAEEKHGKVISSVFSDRVVVELLSEGDNTEDKEWLDYEPIPMPPPDEEDNNGN